MNIERDDHTLRISGLSELGVANAQVFRPRILAALQPGIKTVEVDLSCTESVDIWGVGVLVAVYKAANSRNGHVTFRLCSPRPAVQQVLELTRMHHLFEIVPARATQGARSRPATI